MSCVIENGYVTQQNGYMTSNGHEISHRHEISIGHETSHGYETSHGHDITWAIHCIRIRNSGVCDRRWVLDITWALDIAWTWETAIKVYTVLHGYVTSLGYKTPVDTCSVEVQLEKTLSMWRMFCGSWMMKFVSMSNSPPTSWKINNWCS